VVPGPDGAVAPVFLWDARREALLAFGSAGLAAAHLEPWQEVGSAAAWDAEGRRIAFAVELRPRRVLGLRLGDREVVVVAQVEDSPAGARELRAALLAALARRGGERAALERLDLAGAVAAFTRG
jgi:hypothetical protein